MRASVVPRGLSEDARTSTQQSPILWSLCGNTPGGFVFPTGPQPKDFRLDVADGAEPPENVQEVHGMIRILFLGGGGFSRGRSRQNTGRMA